MIDSLLLKGEVLATIEWEDGRIETFSFSNNILKTGREAVAKSLAREFTDYEFYISKMLFGNGGTSPATIGGTPKYVNTERNGLFGTTVANKPVTCVLDPNDNSQVIITAVIPKDDASNGYVLNEMALQMHNGDLYSMATFPGISKTSAFQITWNWRLSFL